MYRGEPIKKLIIILSFISIIIFIWIAASLKSIHTADVKSTEINSNYTPQVLNSGNESKYVFDLTMDELGNFITHSTISIKNTSSDQWDEVVFYFIPNMFTEENASLDTPANIELERVLVNDTVTSFTLNKDTLTIPLETVLLSGNDIKVDFQYSFTLPEEGRRFTKNGDNYYLAQWYPMLATFRNGKWNKEDYLPYGETYHTAYSDFTLNYKIPKGYTIVTTSSTDSFPSEDLGILRETNAKEFFISILKNPTIIEGITDDINVRVFGVGKYETYKEEILELSLEAVQYFQQTIGEYPFNQLDIILDEIAMEYPGIVTVGTMNEKDLDINLLKSTVVHETAHQWFYGVISNDPFYDGWLDEGFASLITELFYSELKNKKFEPLDNKLPNGEAFTLPVNLPLNQYSQNGTYFSSYHYYRPKLMLWNIFYENGGKERLEEFLKAYYNTYQYKELNSQEFTRFLSNFLGLKNDDYFKDWILLDE